MGNWGSAVNQLSEEVSLATANNSEGGVAAEPGLGDRGSTGAGGLISELLGPNVSRETLQGRLNLGCGRDLRVGWVNLDLADPELLVVPAGVDYVRWDLESDLPLPFGANEFGLVEASHLLEHIRDPLGLAGRLHRVCAHGAEWVIRCPHGGSDDAWGDLTHVRAWYPESFLYFGQPTYWRADYGYRGDWRLQRVILRVREEFCPKGASPGAVLMQAQRLRNVVVEMEARLECVKPIRAMDHLMDGIRYDIQVVSVG